MVKIIVSYFFFSIIFMTIVIGCATGKRVIKNIKDNTLCEEVDVIYSLKYGAKEVTKKAVLKKCDSTESFDIGKNFAKVERWDKALAEFKSDVDENPKDAYAHFNLGVAYEANGNFENAFIEYDKASYMNPNEGYFQQAWKRAKESMEELK